MPTDLAALRTQHMAFVRARLAQWPLKPLYRRVSTFGWTPSTVQWHCFAALARWDGFTPLAPSQMRDRLSEIARLARRLRRKVEGTAELRGWPLLAFLPDGTMTEDNMMILMGLPPIEDALAVLEAKALEMRSWKRQVTRTATPNAKRTFVIKDLSLRLRLASGKWLDKEVAMLATALFDQNVRPDLVRKLRAGIRT